MRLNIYIKFKELCWASYQIVKADSELYLVSIYFVINFKSHSWLTGCLPIPQIMSRNVVLNRFVVHNDWTDQG